MLKRIISVILVFLMILGTVSVVSAEKTTDRNENAAMLLEKLKIVYGKDEEQFNSVVSRADFAVYAARALGIDDNVRDNETRYFIDMAQYDYAAYSVNTLVDRSIISVGDDRLFRPSEPVTYEEAVKIVVSMLGYRPAAEGRGGYPTGYLRVASSLDLVGGSHTGNFSLYDAAQLLYNALITPEYVVGSITEEDGELAYEYYSSPEHTLLYENFGYKFAEGILTGYDDVNIEFDVTASDNRAVVDGYVYSVDDDLDMTDLIGMNVCILYDKDNKIAIAYAQDAGEKVVEIDIKDFVSFKDGKLVYSTDKKDETLDVSQAIVLYNGAVPATGTAELFENLESGTIKVIDSDGRGGYDAVIVNDYHAFVFKSADVNNNIIYSRKSGQDSIELDKYTRLDMIDGLGGKIEIEELETSDVLNICAAKDFSRIKIVVTDTKATGEVNEIKSDDGRISAEVGGIFYYVNRGYTNVRDELKSGQIATVLFNMFGEIVMATDASYGDLKVGYLSGLTFGDDVFNSSLSMRIYSRADGLAIYKTASNLHIDGIRYTDAAKAAASIPNTEVSGGSISFRSQIIQYKLNSDFEVTYIDTYNVSSEESPDTTLCRLTDGKTSVGKNSGRFDKIYPVNSNADIFCAPLEENLTSNASDYYIIKENKINNTVSTKIELYKTQGKNEFVDAAIYRTNPVDAETNDWLNSHMFLVSEINTAVDAEKDEYSVVRGLQQGGSKELNVYNSKLLESSIKVSDIEEGDLIRYRTAYNGDVICIQKLYDVGTGTRINWAGDNDTTSLFDTGFTSNFELSFGYVNKRGEKTVSWGYKTGSQIDEALDLSAVKFMVYDKNQRKGSRVYTAGIDQITDYESAKEECDIIILQTVQTTVRAAVIYKR